VAPRVGGLSGGRRNQSLHPQGRSGKWGGTTSGEWLGKKGDRQGLKVYEKTKLMRRYKNGGKTGILGGGDLLGRSEGEKEPEKIL